MAFEPTTSGPLTGTLTLGDNNLNAAGATQTAALATSDFPPAPTITGGPANGDKVAATFTFTNSASTVTGYCAIGWRAVCGVQQRDQLCESERWEPHVLSRSAG